MSTDLVSWAEALSDMVLSEMGRRWAHVQGVGAAAVRLAEQLQLGSDVAEIVTAAAWVHDVGYGPTLVQTGFHPVDGARFLRELLDVVTFADLTTGPGGATVTVSNQLVEILQRYPAGHLVHESILQSSPSLRAVGDRVQARPEGHRP